ncbi:MAG: hypothetical protein QF755_00460 [Candidatus Peribacteraceae bacterium]|jgi:hypothetical protein|nr:hypothetical protein [Candidatus Peribacteraceae bacterium]HCI04034.1 hypothetical protein [Candidatus Peribacteria bacterium]|tara:strand:+ start:3870 stop:4808 length:939 start_codon:yes stop_codon:yes gene_type:complete
MPQAPAEAGPDTDFQTSDPQSQASPIPEQFTGTFDQIAQLLGDQYSNEGERAKLALALTNIDQRRALAETVAERLIEMRDELSSREGYSAFFEVEADNGQLLNHIRDEVHSRISAQITDEDGRTGFVESLASSIAVDDEALAKIQQQYPDLKWNPKDPQSLQRALHERMLEDFKQQARELQEDLDLEAQVLREKGEVMERAKEGGSMFSWAKERVKKLWAKRSVRIATYVVAGVAVTLLLGAAAYYLLDALQGLHGAALESTAESIGGAIEGGTGALNPAPGLEGVGGSIPGGPGGPPPIDPIHVIGGGEIL